MNAYDLFNFQVFIQSLAEKLQLAHIHLSREERVTVRWMLVLCWRLVWLHLRNPRIPFALQGHTRENLMHLCIWWNKLMLAIYFLAYKHECMSNGLSQADEIKWPTFHFLRCTSLPIYFHAFHKVQNFWMFILIGKIFIYYIMFCVRYLRLYQAQENST